jgi:hypothetical protein
MSTAALLLAGVACILIQRAYYTAKMHRLGAAVIGEAYRVRQEYPQAYRPYYDRAVASLNTHGCADLIQHLPVPEGLQR